MISWLKRLLVGVAVLPALAIASNTTTSYIGYQWHTFLGGDTGSTSNRPASAVDAAGNLYITGATVHPFDSDGNPGDPTPTWVGYLAKISSTGQLMWSTHFTNPFPGRQDGLHPAAIALDSSGNIYIAGSGVIDPHGRSDCGSFVLETNPAGAYLGGVNFGLPTSDGRGTSLVYGMTYNQADGHVYITGEAAKQWWGPGTLVTSGPGTQSMFVLQVGNLSLGEAGIGWLGFYAMPLISGNPDNAVWGQAITADAFSNLYVAGADQAHVAVWRISNSGHLDWEQTYGPPLNYGWSESYAVATDGTSVYVTGFTPGPWSGPALQDPLNPYLCCGGTQLFILKLDTGGNYIWHTFFHGHYLQSIGEGIVLDGPTTVYVGGQGDLLGPDDAAPVHSATGDHFILQLDNNGAYQWHSVYGASPPRWDSISSLALDSQHNLFASGYTGWDTWNGDHDTPPLHAASGKDSEIFVMKFGPAIKVTPVITWATPADIYYGTPLGPTQLNPTADVGNPGTWIYDPAQGTVLHAGAGQKLSVTFTPNDTANYNSATQSVFITVKKATPAITWPAPAAITYGGALGNGQLCAYASVAGSFTYTPPAGTVLPVGNGQTLSVTFTPTDTGNYTTAVASTTINVNAAPPPPSGVNLVVTKVLSRTGGNVVVQLTISNTGGTTANNVTLTSVKVGGVSALTLPRNLGPIGASASAQAIVSVPGTVGGAGVASSLTAAGTYTGGTFSVSMRITLP